MASLVECSRPRLLKELVRVKLKKNSPYWQVNRSKSWRPSRTHLATRLLSARRRISMAQGIWWHLMFQSAGREVIAKRAPLVDLSKEEEFSWSREARVREHYDWTSKISRDNATPHNCCLRYVWTGQKSNGDTWWWIVSPLRRWRSIFRTRSQFSTSKTDSVSDSSILYSI